MASSLFNVTILRVSQPSYMHPAPCTHVTAIVHVSFPSYMCHRPHPCCPSLHTCVPATSTSTCVSPCIPTSFLHPLHLPHLTCIPLIPCISPVSPPIPMSQPNGLPACPHAHPLLHPSCSLPHFPWSCISPCLPQSCITHASPYLCPLSFPPSHTLTSAFGAISPLLFLPCFVLSHPMPTWRHPCQLLWLLGCF